MLIVLSFLVGSKSEDVVIATGVFGAAIHAVNITRCGSGVTTEAVAVVMVILVHAVGTTVTLVMWVPSLVILSCSVGDGSR